MLLTQFQPYCDACGWMSTQPHSKIFWRTFTEEWRLSHLQECGLNLEQDFQAISQVLSICREKVKVLPRYEIFYVQSLGRTPHVASNDLHFYWGHNNRINPTIRCYVVLATTFYCMQEFLGNQNIELDNHIWAFTCLVGYLINLRFVHPWPLNMP